MTTMTDPCKNTTHMQLMEHSGILTVAINTALGTLAFLGPIFRHIGADSSYLAGLTQQLNLIGSRPVPDPSPALLTDVCQVGTLPIIAVQQTNVIDTRPTTTPSRRGYYRHIKMHNLSDRHTKTRCIYTKQDSNRRMGSA